MNRFVTLTINVGLLGCVVACGSSDAATGAGGAGGTAGAGNGGVFGGATGVAGAGGGGAAPGGASGTGGGMGGTSSGGSTAGVGGVPLRPPNPRTDLGPPNGTVCSGGVVPDVPLNCTVGQQCCPGSIADKENKCVAPGALCTNCTFGDCGAVQCDGPEDCPGKLCCYTENGCSFAGAPCNGTYGIAQCADRCESTNQVTHEVVCKDPRDCFRSDQQCVPRSSSTLPKLSTCRG